MKQLPQCAYRCTCPGVPRQTNCSLLLSSPLDSPHIANGRLIAEPTHNFTYEKNTVCEARQPQIIKQRHCFEITAEWSCYECYIKLSMVTTVNAIKQNNMLETNILRENVKRHCLII